ncbi:glycosyltransferase family 9 protein [Nocardioides sp. SYSU DS0651]|uniref:glycosyltransferase family 9 protein n=1 Tax=Nocardioides sp. SYSU DS0651 TaxID=3415955 RepID=UPI003F4B5CDF
MTGAPVRRCLVLRAIGLGDFLTGVPALRALRRALPGAEITLAAPAALSPLVALSGAVDRLLTTPDLGPIAWDGPPPDLAVDLHGNGPASKIPLQELGPTRLLAFAGPGRGGLAVDGPQWRRDEHERVRWCRLVGEGLGVPADPDDLLLARPSPATDPAAGPVVIHPGAAFPSRCWPVERFAAVAAELATHAPVVVTGSTAELPLAEAVRRQAGLPADAVLAGRTDLAGLAAVVAGARLVVSGDTGIAHLASAFATPSVVLFGPIPPDWWGPPASGPHVALWHAEPGELGDPHGAETDERLLRIGVDDVLRAARAALRADERVR